MALLAWAGTALHKEVAMERIEVQHLRNIAGIGLKQNPNRDETALRYFLATVLLRHYLGSTWCDECVKPGQTDVPRGSRAGRLFLRTDNDGSADGYRHQERVERLAELLYNLQDVQGIAGRRASIQEGAVESTYAELEFAGHFIRRGVRVQFLDRSGVKGNDYDFDAGEGATTVCCEVKCRLESTDLGLNTIIKALGTARKQMPADRAAIIGVKIPEPWIREPALRGTFESALASFFRNSGRVVAVVMRWEEVSDLSTGDGVILYKFRTILNKTSRHLSNEVTCLVQQLTQSTGGDWTKFRAFVSALIGKESIPCP
jgi:hypothetical protein